MGCRSDALYLNLLEDLSHVLPVTDLWRDTMWPDVTQKQFAAHALHQSILKKFVDKKSASADSAALDKFRQVNDSCGAYELRLCNTKDEILIGELKHSIYNFWNRNGYPIVNNHFEILDNGRCGPGSSVLSRGKDFYSKLYASPLSTTSSTLYKLYMDYVHTRPEWTYAEFHRREHYGAAEIVEGSCLHFAEKTNDISRPICVEPSLNMFFQLGFGRILERRLNRYFGIDLSLQPEKNRELARRGSISGDLVTIDLSSASDSLALPMLHQVLPKDFMSWLLMMRSDVAQVGKEQLALNMVSTMGNGFTFPLQTMLFACVVSAAARVNDVKLHKPYGMYTGNFAVFGDDIICPQKISRDVLRLLDLLGFKVNTDKTFVEGPFRESCGCDYFLGHNVRGVYIKTLKSQHDRCTAINNLNDWSARNKIPLPRTIQYLLSTIKYNPVPEWENVDAGVRVPYTLVENLKYDKDTRSILYKAWVPRTKRIFIDDEKVNVPVKVKKLIYNPSGLLLSFLHGDIRSGEIGVRLDTTPYRAKWRIAPNWEYSPTGGEKSPTQWRQWRIAVYMNFFM